MGDNYDEDLNEAINASPPEPPAGLDFSNIKLLDLLSRNHEISESGYELIEAPPSYHDLRPRRKPRSCRRSGIYKKKLYCSSFDEKRLRLAANSADGDTVERLIESCPEININAADEKQRTALHFASARGADDVVHVLLKNGADSNVRDVNGNCPLHLAACTHHIRVITLLLHFGADVRAVDFAGQTPLHLALSRLKVLEKREPCKEQHFYSVYASARRKAEVGEIVSMLREYFGKCGKSCEHAKMCEIDEKLQGLSSESEVDEIGLMLAEFTQMTIDAAAKSRMSEE